MKSCPSKPQQAAAGSDAGLYAEGRLNEALHENLIVGEGMHDIELYELWQEAVAARSCGQLLQEAVGSFSNKQ